MTPNTNNISSRYSKPWTFVDDVEVLDKDFASPSIKAM